MMYDKDGNALVGLGIRATKEYSPTQLGLNAVALGGSATVYSNWIEVKGYSLICAIVTAGQNFNAELQLAQDASGTGACSVALATGLGAGEYYIITNQNASNAERCRGGGWNYVRITITNATGTATTATGYMHLQA